MTYELQARFDSRKSFYGKAHVEEDGNTKTLLSDKKKFRITFRSEIFISANSEEEAREKFWEMELYSREASDNGAAFVELNSEDECL